MLDFNHTYESSDEFMGASCVFCSKKTIEYQFRDRTHYYRCHPCKKYYHFNRKENRISLIENMRNNIYIYYRRSLSDRGIYLNQTFISKGSIIDRDLAREIENLSILL